MLWNGVSQQFPIPSIHEQIPNDTWIIDVLRFISNRQPWFDEWIVNRWWAIVRGVLNAWQFRFKDRAGSSTLVDSTSSFDVWFSELKGSVFGLDIQVRHSDYRFCSSWWLVWWGRCSGSTSGSEFGIGFSGVPSQVRMSSLKVMLVLWVQLGSDTLDIGFWYSGCRIWS